MCRDGPTAGNELVASPEEKFHVHDVATEFAPSSELFVTQTELRRRLFYMPGGDTDDITSMVDSFPNVTGESLLVIHASTNDVRETRSEELLVKHHKLIQHYKIKSNNIMIAGVLPKIAAEDLFHS